MPTYVNVPQNPGGGGPWVPWGGTLGSMRVPILPSIRAEVIGDFELEIEKTKSLREMASERYPSGGPFWDSG